MPNDRFAECITTLTPTVARLMGASPPKSATCAVSQPVIDAAEAMIGQRPVEKCLIFCPDAIGHHLWQIADLDFGAVLDAAPIRIPLRSVVPPKTPVCFASMFTGALPEVHGIRRYERPVLTCDTLFDSLIRANKRIAIVAVRDSSIDLIFRGRNLDYYSEEYDSAVIDRALQLLEVSEHDVILVYQQEYDDTLHRTTPLSSECLCAAKSHLHDFGILADAVRRCWGRSRTALVFAPDHGAHLDPVSGHGDHGEDIPEDMELFHCYGFGSASL